MNVNGDSIDVYGLVTELSKHILQLLYRPCYSRYPRFTYDSDVTAIKRLRAKAFEILLNKKKADVSALSEELEETDPIVEIQKYAFVLKVGTRRARDAATLEYLLQELEESSFSETSSVYPVLRLLLRLKDSKSNLTPITNIFYCNEPNPAVPEVRYTDDDVPPFQMYPMECFILSDKFEATLEPRRLPIACAAPTQSVIDELCFSRGPIISRGAIDAETYIGTPVAPAFASTHAFETMSSQAMISSNINYTATPIMDMYVLQEIVMLGDEEQNESAFVPWEKGLVTSYLNLPSAHTDTVAAKTESVLRACKSYDHTTVTDELNDTTNVWNHIWSQVDGNNTDATALEDYRTWECFGEVLPAAKESTFVTDTPAAAIYLAKVKQMNSLPLLSGNVMDAIPLLEQVSTKKFVNDIESMLIGIESDTFEYTHTTGFSLRKGISVYGACSESLENICQEAVNWGNCFKFLTHFVQPKERNGKLIQEGLIYKAMCANIKELLLYYQAALLRIFSRHDKKERLLETLRKVRPVAVLIAKVAKLCELYKENGCAFREGNTILTRIYNEAIKVTDPKVALVFYSLLKACCEVYFRFLQKWMFEGICDDIYGEFMIQVRPQYLRNRSQRFWTKSFSVCNEAVPGFLTDLAESILQCGKTVRLLRICDTKNPVCHVCVTEQPEVKVCLSVDALYEQSSRCRRYESSGKLALGPILDLSTAILNEKRTEKETADFVVRAQCDKLRRIHEREDALKQVARAKREFLSSLKEQFSTTLRRRKEKENESSNRVAVICQTGQDNERTRLLNYYESLTEDVDKRCMRSRWRAKRMTYRDKRVEALMIATRNNCSRDVPSKVIKGARSLITLRSLTETPVSFQDENKNYGTTASRETTGNCDNEKDGFRDFLGNHRRSEGLSEDAFPKHSIAATADIDLFYDLETTIPYASKAPDDILHRLSVYDKDDGASTTIQRPTFLNVSAVDDDTTALATLESRTSKYRGSLGCDMTPNNNQLVVVELQRRNANNLARKASDYSDDDDEATVDPLRRESDFTTPMSCTTDDNNFASLVQSPSSDARDTDTTDVQEDDSRSREAPFPSTGADFTAASPSVTTAAAAPCLSVADVEIIDHTSLQAYLEKSIRIPLNVQSRLVNNAVIKYFLKENNLLLHLHSLRSYFFLLNGEFAKSLTDSLYARLYDISIPVELFNSATLTNLLERALVNSFNNVYVNSELLSLSATDTPAQLHAFSILRADIGPNRVGLSFSQLQDKLAAKHHTGRHGYAAVR
ncbi:gamma-tubulin complex component 6 isoform X2 [Andrena cerasifolii]|uniref:gamma-tubulin complex component 6 isoform X2 n=1 Tax=Andrena cerasifolii TaxID=2819439 RepID=UPI004037D3DB